MQVTLAGPRLSKHGDCKYWTFLVYSLRNDTYYIIAWSDKVLDRQGPVFEFVLLLQQDLENGNLLRNDFWLSGGGDANAREFMWEILANTYGFYSRIFLVIKEPELIKSRQAAVDFLIFMISGKIEGQLPYQIVGRRGIIMIAIALASYKSKGSIQ